MAASRRPSGDQERRWTWPGCLRTGPSSRFVPGVPGADLQPEVTGPRRSGSRPGSRPRIGRSGRSGPSPVRSRDPRSGPGRPPLALASRRPSGLQLSPARRQCEPVRVPRLMVRSCRPLPVSQTRIVPSSPRVARRFPSGRKATARTNRVVPDQLVPDPAIGQADQVGRDGRRLAGAHGVGVRAADRQEAAVGAHGDAVGLGGGGQGDGPQLGAAPLVEVGPLPAAAVRLAGPGAALVQQAAGRGGVEQAEGALGLADPGDVEVLLGPLALAVGLRAASASARSAFAPRCACSRRAAFIRFGQRRHPPGDEHRGDRRHRPAPPSAPPRGPR